MTGKIRIQTSYALAFAVCLLLPKIILAGPPLICHPLDIGGAKSLPWTDDLWNLSGRADYNLNRLVDDTLALLTPDLPVIVRMETLRRATLYARKDSSIAKQLILRLRARAVEAEAKGDAVAWFDFGYVVECFKQANMNFKKRSDGSYEPVVNPNAASDIDGYGWVLKAIRQRGKDPEMELAAALITEFPKQKSHDEHLRKAIAGAADGSLLAKNLVGHFGEKGSTIAELRAKYARL